MHIAIAADHNGVELKNRLIGWLTEQGHGVDDRSAAFGSNYSSSADEIVDYPPLCADVCRQVVEGPADRGVVVGGSGLGETIVCNKVRGVRAGLCHDVWSAGISRGNNDANVLVLAAKVLEPTAAEQILETWLDTPFKGGVHRRRLEQIAAIEQANQVDTTHA
jgi:ribose 5-phosphate isomerase B